MEELKEQRLEEKPKTQEESQVKEEEVKYWKDLALRYAAEIENLKKSFKKEKEEYYKFALENLFKEILPCIDNLERALEAFSTTQNIEALKQGVELTFKSLITTLEKFGLKQVFPSVGEPFHPFYHEALSTEPHSEVPSGSITKVYQKGYTLHDRLIRPALVCVCMGKKTEKNSSKETEENIVENE
ncbi:nucleotide exchange factor GrpE [Thermodesulfobacterium sp. TA1]|uniref:nucleotide exchange factor GrpE n=1 Tax=Thermodesulfobacterium sp. TA1 TaxID=2234087 RepID=UPI00123279D9|nr:nucleotide exchange factor GrpE [Thermodesulfobacterium sp. TA1]QER42345.1 nucleotide exchange factor GrpE [Thermodesulfobacterium sp. TA1]